MGKRKRPATPSVPAVAKRRKRGLPSDGQPSTVPSTVAHPVLSSFYPQVLTLRQYLLTQLPQASKHRRRKIANYGQLRQDMVRCEEAAQLLDSTFVGLGLKPAADPRGGPRVTEREMEVFSQQLTASTARSEYNLRESRFLQAEIVDFVVWLLFRRTPASRKPSHLLCNGYQRAGAKGRDGLELSVAPGIPGIMALSPNAHVETVKSARWAAVLCLLGEGGDKVMMDLLLDCGLFCAEADGNVFQVSGVPLSDLKPLPQPFRNVSPSTTTTRLRAGRASAQAIANKPSSIRFVRSRILYARPATNANGRFRVGLRHVHVLNRYPDVGNHGHTAIVLKYMFPRQFGLHNVFTSTVDYKESSLPFKDYTLRDEEIARHNASRLLSQRKTSPPDAGKNQRPVLPKRLRGTPFHLVERLRARHQKCAYAELLRRYCLVEGFDNPSRESPTSPDPAPVEQTSFTDLATPARNVSAFCRAALSSVIPTDFFGDGEVCRHNLRVIHRWVDRFILLRRFESVSLHQVVQELQIARIPWLTPYGTAPDAKPSLSDFTKRREIFYEFVYYLFDSILIPLISANFYVTESQQYKNKLFYFRHDVWQLLAAPSLKTIKSSLFEEVGKASAKLLLDARTLGYSSIRLLPKAVGARVIMNLRKRTITNRYGKLALGRSINSIMAPAHQVLNYERAMQSTRFGSSLFSVAEIFSKIKTFHNRLRLSGHSGGGGQPLYFCKVDVASCFDTIPQEHLLSLVDRLLSMPLYYLTKHAEISLASPPQLAHRSASTCDPKLGLLETRSTSSSVTATDHIPITRIKTLNRFPDGSIHASQVGRTTAGRRNTVFVGSIGESSENRTRILELLHDHIQFNLVKVGRKYYRQKSGIPQGSVVSALLCNFFYADFEQRHLSFINGHEEEEESNRGGESLLMRLLDDFLLVTTSRAKAERFMHVLHAGNKDFDIEVKREKSLANFNISVGGQKIPTTPRGTKGFPYCGISIDMKTLEVRKHADGKGNATVSDSLTIDVAKRPGQAFYRKMVNAFKLQLLPMFLDTAHNDVVTVLSNLAHSFSTCAVRCAGYLKEVLSAFKNQKGSAARILIRTIESVNELAFLRVQGGKTKRQLQNESPAATDPSKSATKQSVHLAISRRQVHWISCRVFQAVFQRRQTRHGEVVKWLEGQLRRCEGRMSAREWKTARRAARDFVEAQRG